MKSESEIRQKYTQLVGRNLEKVFQKRLGRKPHNCEHNYVQSSLTNKGNRIEVEHTGLCMFNSNDPASWEGKICETAADARFCPYFNPRETKQQVYEDFMGKLADPETLQREYRDLHILQWVLEEQNSPPRLSLWGKLKLWTARHFDKSEYTEELDTISTREVDDLSKKLFSDS